MKSMYLILLVIVLATSLVLGACTSSTPTTAPSGPPPGAPSGPPPGVPSGPPPGAPSGPPPGAPSGPPPGAPSGPPPGHSTPAAAKTLNIGLVAWFGSASSLDSMHGVEVLVDADNKNGGIDIGGERYQIHLIEYDSNNAQKDETAAINRLIFQDKVKYIISLGAFQDAWTATTDENKVIALTQASDINMALRTNFHYSFNGSCVNPQYAVITGWFVKTYPDLVKNVVRAFPDNQMGHFLSMAIGGTWKTFGITPTDIWFPATQQDLSAVGTKVVSLGATSFMGIAGGAVGDALIYNAVANAGFNGQFFTTAPNSTEALKQVLVPEALEGFIGGAYATEFDAPLTPNAKAFKDAWIAKNGSWQSPADISGTSSYYCLKAALQQAGSLDVDKVADVLANGMKYETVNGPAQMTSRLDLGNSRTVDSISTTYIKKIHNKQPTLAATIGIDEVLGYMQKAFPPLPPGATPPGPPGPPGP